MSNAPERPHFGRELRAERRAARDPSAAISGPNAFLLGALIVMAALLAYAPALGAGFVWDDQILLLDNPLVHAPDGLHRMWCATQTPDYFPLAYSMYWVEWRLWGANAAGYHLVNVLLHAASAVLLWRVLLRLRVPGAWLAGLLFALHPVAVESVAWISERRNTLSLALFMASLLAYLRFDECEPQENAECRVQSAECRMESGSGFARKSKLRSISSGEAGSSFNSALCILHSAFCTPIYLFSLALFLLALLSKTSVVILPLVLLGCAWWRRNAVTRRDLLRVLPFAALAAAMGLVTVWYQYNNAIGATVVRTDSPAARAAGAGWAAWFYLYKALLPVSLCVNYPRWTTSASPGAFVPALLFLAMLILFARFRLSWGRPLLFALGYFLVALLPVLGFLNISFMAYSLVADHWQYPALIGVVALAAGLLGWLMKRAGTWRKVAMAAAGALVLVCGVLTFRQARIYHDEETLWRNTLETNPKSWLACSNLGAVLARKARAPSADSAALLDEAERYCDEAIKLKPDYALAYLARGDLLATDKRYDEALRDCDRAIALLPGYAEGYDIRGNVWAAAGRYGEAIADYDQAIAGDPDDAKKWYNRATALAKSGHLEDGLRDLDQAVALNPDYAEAYFNRGIMLAVAGRYDKAIGDYTRAIQINPGFVAAYLNRAISYYRIKDYAHALSDVRAAERLGGHPPSDFLSALSTAAGRTNPPLPAAP